MNYKLRSKLKSRELGSKGFTLMELIVVISIIGVLAALLLVNFQSARERARDAARKSDLRQIKSALRLYYNDAQEYPLDNGSGQINTCGAGNNSPCVWGVDEFSFSNIVYMGYLPADPVNTPPYEYAYTRLGQDEFTLETYLENASDEDPARSQLRCDPNVTSLTDADIVPRRYLTCQD